jgi:hypothetical protein
LKDRSTAFAALVLVAVEAHRSSAAGSVAIP